VIAHSMGNLVLMEALRKLAADRHPLTLDEVILPRQTVTPSSSDARSANSKRRLGATRCTGPKPISLSEYRKTFEATTHEPEMAENGFWLSRVSKRSMPPQSARTCWGSGIPISPPRGPCCPICFT
jgi:hypothetical protein